MCTDPKETPKEAPKQQATKPRAPRNPQAAKQQQAPKQARPTVTSLEVKLAASQAKIDGNTANIAGNTKKVRAHQARLDSLDFLTREIGNRLAETHSMVVTGQAEIDERVSSIVEKALVDGQLGGRKSFLSSLRSAGVDDVTLTRVLLIFPDDDDEFELTDQELLTEWFTAFVALNLSHEDVLVRLGAAEKQLATASSDIIAIKSVAETQDRIPAWSWIVALLFGVTGFLWWNFYDWGVSSIDGSTTSAISAGSDIKGTATVTNHLTMSPVADHWYFALMFGFAIFLVVLGLASFLASGKTKVTEETQETKHNVWSAVSASYKARREAVKAERAESRANGRALIGSVAPKEEVISN
ncbi:MAG: hypothetical protein ABI220_05575 [Candidatus Saccharimonadales bacterium]